MDLDFKGDTITTYGDPLTVGETFPDFTVLDKDNNAVKLNGLLDKPVLISVVPDINTRVCSIQTKHFNEEVAGHSEINFVTVKVRTVDAGKLCDALAVTVQCQTAAAAHSRTVYHDGVHRDGHGYTVLTRLCCGEFHAAHCALRQTH